MAQSIAHRLSEIVPLVQTCVCCLLLTALSACASQSRNPGTTLPEPWKDRIAATALEELKQQAWPSLQVAVVHNGDVVFEGAYGLADVENEVAATPETKYRTASITKWMTATATMRLAERGQLDLDAPIQAYCPGFPDKRWPITTRHLLTHTSGIRHYADYDAELTSATTDAARDAIERRRDRDRLGTYTRYTDIISPLDNFKDDPLLFQPGTEFSYSSHGYRVLACVLQGAAGRSYRALMREEIFEPAGMTGIVEDDAWAIVPHRAAGYRLIDEQPLRRADMRDVSENLPAGGHLATASNLVSFAHAFDAGRLVSEETISLMSRPFASDTGQPASSRYGYGVMFFDKGTEQWLGHTGGQAGASAILILVPDQNLSIASMCNAKGCRGLMTFTEKVQAIVANAVSGPRPSASRRQTSQ